MTTAVKELLEAGADKDAASRTGETPLFMAAQEGHENTARVLLEAGADPDIPNLHGLTALHSAIGRRDERVLSMLLAHNADPNMMDDLSRSTRVFKFHEPNLKCHGHYTILVTIK